MNMPKDIDVQAAAQPAAEEASQVSSECLKFEVNSNKALETAVVWIAMIKNHSKVLEEKRKSFTAPLREALDRINAFFKPASEALALAEMTLKNKVSKYSIDAAVERDKVLAAVDPNDGIDAKQAALVKADSLQVPKFPGFSLRETWQGKVTDNRALVKWAVENGRLDLLVAEHKPLIAQAKKDDRDPGVPGFKASKVRTVVITPQKVVLS